MNDIYLYPTTDQDYEDYYMVRSDPTDVYWNGYISKPEKESFREGFLKRTSKARFSEPEDRRNYLIRLIDTDETVGYFQLIMRSGAVEISYSVMQKHQRKGYATKAISLGLKIAKTYNLPIIVSIRDDNIGSQKAAGNNGFVRTDIFEERDYPVAGMVKLRRYLLQD